MKVLMFGWEFPPHITGGLGTACYGLTQGLAANDVETIFVVPKAWGDEDSSSIRLVNASDISIDLRSSVQEEYWKKISYIETNVLLQPYLSPEIYERLTDETLHDYTDVNESVFSQFFRFSGGYGENLMMEVARYAIIAAKLAAEQEFDVIHAHDWLAYPAGIAAKEISGKPLVIHVHATEFDRSGDNVNQEVYDIERRGMEAADRVIAVSFYTQKIIIERYGISPEKVVTVHNAVLPRDKPFGKFEDVFPEKIVTFLGRITMQKGPDYFIEAAYKVLQRDKNVRFVMAGSGDLLWKMVKRVAELRMSSRFHFTGFLQGDDVDKMYAMSDVYVMPSVSEPFGITPLEAMRANVPVIVSKQSGVSEILHHAIKIDFWDIDAMADAIHSFLNYQAITRIFAKAGKEEVENLKWTVAARKVKMVYLGVVE